MARATSGVVLGATIALLGVVGTLALGSEAIEDDVELYCLFNLRGPWTPPDDVVVVAVDPATTEGQRLAVGATAPSRRRAHAAALDRLSAAGATVVAFDLQFDPVLDDPASDEAFAQSIRQARNVVLVETIRRESQNIAAGQGHSRGSVIIDTPQPPAEVLREAARGYAAFQLPRTSRVDAYWAFPSRADNRSSLPVLAFHVFAAGAYDDLVRVWRRAAPAGGAAALPDAAVVASLPPSEAVRRLRAAMASQPDVVAAALEQLDSARASDLSPPRKRMVRALLSLYSGGSIRYLNYYGPPRTLQTIPYEALAGSADPRAERIVRGKAVFVGYSGGTTTEQDRIRDDYVTVFADSSGLRLSGVEIAATAFANILDDNDVQRLSTGPRLALLVVAGFLLGLLARILRPSWALPAVLLLGGVYLAIAAWLFAATALAIPLLVPGIQALLALIAGALLSYRESRREREAIAQTFGYFLPRNVVAELAKGIGPLREDNQLVHGAILSSDVEGYSAIAERTEPRELARLMDRYFAELFAPVKEHGGIVLDVTGDGMLAIWTSPVSAAGFRRRACNALLDAAARIDRFNAGNAGGPLLRTRLALHCGELMLGSFGAAEHFEYRAVGDIVNTTARIDGLNKVLRTSRLVSDVTLEGLDEFVVRPLGAFVLAGKSQPVAVSELIGRRGQIEGRWDALCRRFARGLAAYVAGDLRSASETFTSLLADIPDDGPTSFYLARCADLARGQRAAAWDPTVRIDTK
ncbi:MAG TPA: adenylate/guanylate cyclase domain-containing protein [Casimicrobiaceae bacterium]|nr:adenylate/guanylate cyclase domain-containing protein [Casimicrobiaceae bacterium]